MERLAIGDDARLVCNGVATLLPGLTGVLHSLCKAKIDEIDTKEDWMDLD